MMELRKATIRDAKEMHLIHENAVRITCKNFYTKEQIDAWLEGRSPESYHEGINKGDIYIAENEGEIAGYGRAIPGEVVSIFVDPIAGRKGIGKALLNYGLQMALKDHKKVELEATLNAEGFYKKHGFVKVRNDVHVRRGVEAPVVIMEYSTE
jgi:GNAT superfamily N-acetyltransferase